MIHSRRLGQGERLASDPVSERGVREQQIAVNSEFCAITSVNIPLIKRGEMEGSLNESNVDR